MKQPLLLISLSLAVLLSVEVLAQGKVPIQFDQDPVVSRTGADVQFTVLTVSDVLSMTWEYQGGVTLGLYANGAPVVNPVPQFNGRLFIRATQLQINGVQIQDAGQYTVTVIPSATTLLTTNSKSIQLKVLDPVVGVSLVIPSVAVEGGNVTLRCTLVGGSEVTFEWSKGGASITADSRITLSGGSLVINPARRSDAGEYSCKVLNLINSLTSTGTLDIKYGPDTPVLTKEAPKDCVGKGDVLVGQTVRITCVSDSDPAAIFTWRRDGQSISSSQSDSGVLSLQTFSTNESGTYVCTARNGVTGGTSEQSTVLTIVDTCLDGGEVAGIVIGAFLLLVIIVLLILLIVVLVRKRRAHRQRSNVVVQKTNPNPRPIPPDPQPNGARELGQGPHPPLYHTNTQAHHLNQYTALHESRGNLQTSPANGGHNSDTHRHNGRIHTNGLPHNAIQNGNSNPHNGIVNPAFTQTDAQDANMLPNTQQQNSSVHIQAGAVQNGTQPPAVHVSLNTLPQTGQHNNNAQMPTIHVSLNSYSANGQHTQQDSSFPVTNTANSNVPQGQQNMSYTGQSHPRMQHAHTSYPADPQLSGHIDTGHQAQPGLIPTGYTHFNSNGISRQNADTQTYQQDTERHRRPERSSETPDATPSSSRRQRPWDLLRGTPSYPSGTLQRRPLSPEYTSNTDYTSPPPVRESRTLHRSQPRPRSPSTSRSRAPARHDNPSDNRRRWSHSADLQSPNSRSVTQLEAVHNTHRSPRTQRESAPRDIRGLSHTASRQEATHSSNPQALPLMSQQAPVGHTVMSQRPITQQELTTPQGADTRALADPNHLPQAHMAKQHTTAPVQTTPQGLGIQAQPVTSGASHPLQRGTAPVSHPSAQPKPSNLTQAALKAHTDRSQAFKNRNQQTQAALLHPGPQTRAPAAAADHPPTPPPVIPLTQFQTLPKLRTQTHKSPARGLQPPKPPVNIPVAQRPVHIQQRPNVHHHHATMPANHRHHHGPVQVSAHRHAHAHGHGHPAHFTNPRQQPTHRGRPR